MRLEFLPSIDFNQMLVYSTFAHLLFLTWVMFLPSDSSQEQIVVPTFRVDLIELSEKAKPVPLLKNKKVVPRVTKKKAEPKAKPIIKKRKKSIDETKPKQLSPPKTLFKESRARKKIIVDLKSLETNPVKRSPLQQLDLLARLPEVQEQKTVSAKIMQEETFHEQDREKAAKLSVSKRLAKLDLEKENQPISSLMKELEAIENKEVHPADIAIEGEEFEESNSLSALKNIKGESFASVVEKLQELEESSEEIKIDVSQGQVVLKKFKTSIQRDGVPIHETKKEPELSSALSRYVGEVYKRVYSKWKTPLGANFNDVKISFTIFSKGNINTPVIRKNSGDENLDSIAISAIIDSVPFPALPENLNRPNLKINIIFKYVPEKK